MENIIYVKNGNSIKEAQLKARSLKNATVIVGEGVYTKHFSLMKETAAQSI